MNIIDEFKKCLNDMSYVRAGWDFYDMPAHQKGQEASMGAKAKARACEIWRENPAMHDNLRAAFREVRPLATMEEIERA